ncbi:hypothetical protein EN780_26140 [Mesorhizobium sp. M4B.F.Ca.ET.089.01.1.1]|uniref:hypothetical protein n=1 Tax=Mesorhizobium sp. M4B.F.Ca.ET.089.01.1.1 TaxID=2496662 RepID=UPI000FE3F4EA|nr:hypothetical protein [Mesorhizobium sp. M4B.F.Ca.ET.089.01.1.1]RWX62600.1 hypothetical protein EN780_26140 [Mesorhizobium sp. M4B.F.Ca.ET.089.01.1.1]
MAKLVQFKDVLAEGPVLVNIDLVRIVREDFSDPANTYISFDNEHGITVEGDLRTVWKSFHG